MANLKGSGILLPSLRNDLPWGQTALEQPNLKGMNHAGPTGQIVGQGNRFGNGKENSLGLDPHRLAIRARKILFVKIAYLQARKSLLNCLHDVTVDQLARLPGPIE